MKKNFSFYWVACLLFWATLSQNALAQEPVSFGAGWYRIAMDTESLDILNDGQNDKVRLAKTGKFTGQYWKIARAESDGANRYYLSTQWQGETKVLTLVTSEDKDGNTVMNFRLTKKLEATDADAGYQHWEIGSADDLVQNGKNLFVIHNTHAGMMSRLTYEKKKLDLVYKEPSDATQIWTITAVK